jgi:S-adenosylmethionine:diacylglycerol 3-amino-3-carboxypropyl transferase
MHEDWTIETEVFAPGTRVFSIASAGCTAMALAAHGYEVVAVDVNPAQVAYVRERLAGGPPREGEADRRLSRARGLQHLVGWTGLLPFLEMERPEDQLGFWDARLDTRRLRLLLDLVFSAPVLAVGYRSEFRRAIPSGFGRELRRRLRRGFGRHPNRANPYAWRLMLGREPAGAAALAVPPGAVTVACADAAEYLEKAPAGAFAGFTLSNILDSAGERAAARLRAAVRRAASAEATVVLRSFASAADAASEQWAARDRAFLWGSVRVVRAAEL